MAVNKNGGVPIAVAREDVTTAAITAATAVSGLKFGSPTTFNSTSNYTIPAGATTNSTIMIESIGGGSGGGGTSTTETIAGNNVSAWYGSSSSNNNLAAGEPAEYFLGVYRLGFFSNAPAGETITVTVGAGGTGSSLPTQNLNIPGSSYYSYNRTAATSGGASSVTYTGVTFATGGGGAASSTANNGTAYSTSAVFMDSTTLPSVAYKGGVGRQTITWTSLSTNTPAGVATPNTLGIAAREDFGSAVGNILGFDGNIATNAIVTLNAAGNVTKNGTDATGGGQGGGPANVYGIRFNTAGSYNITSRGGNGAAPGGGGGGGWSPLWGTPGNYTLSGGQQGGNGGSGRVKIWFQA